jgi:hypothetical protein
VSVFTVTKDISLLAVILGFGGAWLTFKGGDSGGGLGAYANQALIDEMRRIGKSKKRQQKIGFILILISLFLQGSILLFPTF